jgi:lipopolysaccharide biosynthesis glycosyltransferase
MDSLHLACAARSDYVPHAAAMLHSALVAGGVPVEIHFLCGPDLTRDDEAALRGMVSAQGGRISLLRVTRERVQGLRTQEATSEQDPVLPASHWYRVFLPDLLPELERVLYLDADTIVVDSLEPLWRTELGSHPLAAVTNVFQPDHVGRLAALGLGDDGPYFNSGVMLLNLEIWRRERLTEQLLDYARANREKLDWPEQDALNVILGERRLPLHPRWNCMNSILLFPASAEVFGFRTVEEARRNPAIRHFEGPSINKPWHYLCQRENRELYLRHRRETPWPELQLEGRTPRNALRRFRRALRRPVRRTS